MADIDEFVSSPSHEFLDRCTKEQLLSIAERYEIVIKDKRLKENVKIALKIELIEKGLLDTEMKEYVPVASELKSNLSFEQQKELLLLQMDHEKLKLRSEQGKMELEKAKLDLEFLKLNLMKEGKLSSSGQEQSMSFSITSNLKLVPKFNEEDPDTFFILFERMAELRNWSDENRVALLQCVLTGKAQVAFTSLSVDDCKDYDTVKSLILKAYECVPEAYRQHFRLQKKDELQTNLEFVRDLRKHFNHWCKALDIKTLEDLVHLMVLEQFKNSVPSRIAMYISEHNVKTPEEAAMLADDFVLTHKTTFVDWLAHDVQYAKSPSTYNRVFTGRFDPSKICNYCHEKGHWKVDCPVLKNKSKSNAQSSQAKPSALAAPVLLAGSEIVESQKLDVDFSSYSPFITEGRVSLVGEKEEIPVKILRDTGAMDSFILESVLPFSLQSHTGESVLIRGIGLNTLSVPLHKVRLQSDLIQGEVVVGVRPALPVEGVHIILGNGLVGERVWADTSLLPIVTTANKIETELSVLCQDSSCVVTRAMKRANDDEVCDQKEIQSDKGCSKLFMPDLSALSFPVSAEVLGKEQRTDSSLDALFQSSVPPVEECNVARGYLVHNGVLLRKWSPHKDFVGDPVFQVVVPTNFRQMMIEIAHDQLGHQGVRKTYDRLLRYFFWPRLKRDVSAYIKRCKTCQLTSKPNQVLKPAPLKPIQATGEPFEHLVVDCVGPLPRSKSGSSYLFTVMCLNTRFPAAYPLRTITSRSVVKALTQFISVFGIPKIIQSDQGSNLTSHLFQQVLKQLHIKHNQSTAFHAQSQGALERFHQSLKSLLRAYCVQLDRDWEEGLPWMMLAAREVVQESMGFSPNDLVFGHNVRGLLSVFQQVGKAVEPPKNLVSYVLGFKNRLIQARELAKLSLEKHQKNMKRLYDRTVERRVFVPGDQVLVLRPMVSSPFEAKFDGPFVVKRKLTDENYEVSMPLRKKSVKRCHVNLLKPYYEKENSTSLHPALSAVSIGGGNVSLVGEEEETISPDDCVFRGRLNNSESLHNLAFTLRHLSPVRCQELCDLLRSFPELFGDAPSRTDWVEHDIDVGDAKPIKQRFYRVAPEKRELMEKEIKYMQDHNIAVPSFSDWASPCILVGKSDGTVRFCTDFRKVNALTKPDCFPLPRVEDCVDQVGSAKFVSKFDLLKGYWQVPLTKRAQEISSFVTPSGLHSYQVMSFGLRNAPATFQRLMNRVICGLEGCAVYLDDLVVFSDSWESHLKRLRSVLRRLADARLTVNLAKCEFAKATVTYLGKVVGNGEVRPMHAKVQAVQNFPSPTTKKELMRFLGLVGYYRSFCRNFSTVVAPLTDLLKGKTKFIWSNTCELVFENVKSLLCSAPVLMAPCFDKPFTLHVDASNVGAGAVLQQSDVDGVYHPVSFFSRKFNTYQCNYSVVEKEALALIWALQHFAVYLNSSAPIVIYTDHNPLTFLNSLQCPNQRLVRWSLFLQSFCLDIRHIRGSENVVADALSRIPDAV